MTIPRSVTWHGLRRYGVAPVPASFVVARPIAKWDGARLTPGDDVPGDASLTKLRELYESRAVRVRP
jgi:hypothetical protein